MVEVRRDLCGSSSPTLLPKQGHLQQAAQDLVQAGVEYLQRRRLHHLPGQPVPVLSHPQREGVLPHVQMELPVPQFVNEYVVLLQTYKGCLCFLKHLRKKETLTTFSVLLEHINFWFLLSAPGLHGH